MGRWKRTRVDHISAADTLDNRRSNLRRATPAQNGMNRPAPKHNTSGFKGVAWHKQAQRWRAYIKVNRKQISLGVYGSKEEAAKAYDRGAWHYFGEFAILNFPRKIAA